jgi:Ca2+-binding EF-hand superfamily protein
MMHKKFLIGGGTVAAAAIVAAVAIAAPGRVGKGDTDGDGALSKAEVTAMATEHFTRMDANGDGQLDAADRAAMHKARFTEMDGDKNGSISEAEFTAAHSAWMEKRGEHRKGMGGGHDGRGHRGGRGGGMMLLKVADSNGDQTVTKAEITAAIDTHFTKADTNKDGKISPSEHSAMRQAMRERMKAATTN